MTKLFAALAATLILATAGVASAQDYRRGDNNNEWRGRGDNNNEWRGRGGEIVVRDLRGRTQTYNRRDREFDTLLRSPFAFRPGLLYVYTNDCRRGECQVYIYEPGQRRARGHLWAPTLNDSRYFRNYRWGDRRQQEDEARRRGDDDRRDRDWD